MSDKHHQLIEASIDLFAEKGFWNTPTSQIAKHAGVATGTLFNYFPTKDDLIDAVYLRLKDESTVQFWQSQPNTNDMYDMLHHVWQGFVHWATDNPSRFLLLEQLKLSDLVSDEAQSKFRETLSELEITQKIDFSSSLGGFPLEMIAGIMEANLLACTKYALAHELDGKPLNDHITTSLQIVWKGITT